MRTPLVSPLSKPSIRKHSCFDKLFVEDYHLPPHHQPEKHLAFSPPPPSSNQNAHHPRIYTCLCFFFFFLITIAAFLLCNNLDAPASIETAHDTTDSPKKWQSVYAETEKPIIMSALRGLGSVYRKGNKAMTELVVAHIDENTALPDFRLFLRTLHRCGMTARADVVFLFAWNTLPLAMVDVIHEENQYFDKLVQLLSRNQVGDNYKVSNLSSLSPASSSPSPLSSSPWTPGMISNAKISPFDINAFRKSVLENTQPLWGSRALNTSQANRAAGSALTERGSIVGFDMSELNPEDALQGFIDNPPIVLRRWACYQMLLGMVRHRFKHILLTDVSGVAVLRDPFTIARRRVGLYLSMEDRTWGATVGAEFGLRFDVGDVEQVLKSERASASVNISDVVVASRRQLNARIGVSDEKKSSSSSQEPGARILPRRMSTRRQSNVQAEIRRRSNGGRKRRGRKPVPGGLYERVYGRRMWSSLEESERRKKLVNSAVIMGSIQQVRGLANTMVTEIVKVALERKNREPFPDNVLLSYLLHKSSSVLGKRVVEHLHLLNNSESFVHSLVCTQQPSVFMRRTRAAYPIIHGSSKSKRWHDAVQAILRDLCSSPVDAMVYTDCSQNF